MQNMPNPLFNILGGGTISGPSANIQQMMRQFQQFKESFQGDPKKEVERLLQSGRINQQQLNQLQELAKQFSQLMK